MSQSFQYLLDKLDAATISDDPFPHVYIEDFLSGDDFEAVVASTDVNIPPAQTVEALFSNLDDASYRPIEFPGCTTSKAEYLQWLERSERPTDTHAACEAQGMALRCTEPRSEAIRSLDTFFQSSELRDLLTDKFDISDPVSLDCGLQKYLNGYEISPHPDIRQKALTWMLNVNPGKDSEREGYHTHYMKFKAQWDFVPTFWRNTPKADTCWVPWEWCDTYKQQTKNNSIVVFSPRHDTMHGVRAHYDHLSAQRTQYYGNLWYRPKTLPFRPQFEDFAGGAPPKMRISDVRLSNYRTKTVLARAKARFVEWTPHR